MVFLLFLVMCLLSLLAASAPDHCLYDDVRDHLRSHVCTTTHLDRDDVYDLALSRARSLECRPSGEGSSSVASGLR